MRLGGAGLPRHRQAPADGTGRTGGRSAACGPCPARWPACWQDPREPLVHTVAGVRHFAATAVEDLVDRVRRTPHAAGGQRRGDIGQFERVELERAEGEGAEVLLLDVVGEAAVVVRVIGPALPGSA